MIAYHFISNFLQCLCPLTDGLGGGGVIGSLAEGCGIGGKGTSPLAITSLYSSRDGHHLKIPD